MPVALVPKRHLGNPIVGEAPASGERWTPNVTYELPEPVRIAERHSFSRSHALRGNAAPGALRHDRVVTQGFFMRIMGGLM